MEKCPYYNNQYDLDCERNLGEDPLGDHRVQAAQIFDQ